MAGAGGGEESGSPVGAGAVVVAGGLFHGVGIPFLATGPVHWRLQGLILWLNHHTAPHRSRLHLFLWPQCMQFQYSMNLFSPFTSSVSRQCCEGGGSRECPGGCGSRGPPSH